MGYHGTSYAQAKQILKHGFSEAHFPNWTGDLGRGVYGYIEAPERPFSRPEYNATAYALIKSAMRSVGSPLVQRAYGSSRVAVVQFKLDVADNDIGDFNTLAAENNIITLKKNFENLIHQHSPSHSGAASRDNEDGIILEYLIERHLVSDFPVIVKDTYSQFFARMSNFPNGREICVRNTDCISAISIL